MSRRSGSAGGVGGNPHPDPAQVFHDQRYGTIVITDAKEFPARLVDLGCL